MRKRRDNKVIALDVDGVLFDFMTAYDKAAELYLGREVTPDLNEFEQSEYHLGLRVGVNVEVVNDILNYMVDNGMYRTLKAYPGVKEAVKKIEDAGFDIYIVTAIPENVKEDRLYNIEQEIGLKPKGIYCVGMGLSKEAALNDLKPDVFVDDRVKYLEDAGDSVYHLCLIDQNQTQENNNYLVDAISPSLKVWTDKYLDDVASNLDMFYKAEKNLQNKLKLENMDTRIEVRKYRSAM